MPVIILGALIVVRNFLPSVANDGMKLDHVLHKCRFHFIMSRLTIAIVERREITGGNEQ